MLNVVLGRLRIHVVASGVLIVRHGAKQPYISPDEGECRAWESRTVDLYGAAFRRVKAGVSGLI